MNTIMLSVHPEPLSQILNGEKSDEIRTRVPKLPCEVFLYCTKKEYTLMVTRKGEINMIGDLLEKPEFIKMPETMRHFNSPLFDSAGKVVAKFVVKTAHEVTRDEDGYVTKDYLNSSCLTQEDFDNYMGGVYRPLYAWHITDLVIFEKPMELGEFVRFDKMLQYGCIEEDRERYAKWVDSLRLSRAPQSWQYIIPPKCEKP